MNMNFQRLHAFEAEFLSLGQVAAQGSAGNTAKRRSSLVRYALATLAGCALGYGLMHSSLTTLLVLGGVFLTVAGFATATCIYAQNNSLW